MKYPWEEIKEGCLFVRGLLLVLAYFRGERLFLSVLVVFKTLISLQVVNIHLSGYGRACGSIIVGVVIPRAKRDLDDHLTVTEKWAELCSGLDRKMLIMAPFCGDIPCEDFIKKNSAR